MSETKTVFISDAQFKHFRALCGNGNNWTDGGYWNGAGKAPSCFQSQTFSKKSKIIVRWPTESSAKRWNEDWEQAQRNMGYVGTGLATVALWYGKIGQTLFSALVANVGLDVLKGESIAAIPYPQAKAGWKMITELDFHFYRSVSAVRKDTLRVSKVVYLVDDKNQQHVFSKPHSTLLIVENHIEELVLQLFGEPGRETAFDY
jgi:hypothetical protein